MSFKQVYYTVKSEAELNSQPTNVRLITGLTALKVLVLSKTFCTKKKKPSKIRLLAL